MKNKFDYYENFKEKYLQIIQKLGFDSDIDSLARDFLSSILDHKKQQYSYDINNILLKFTSTIQSVENIFIFGCGPSLELTLKGMIDILGTKFYEKKMIIAADGASRLLTEMNIPITAIFTDLDGINYEDFNNTEFIIIHAHGDNIEKLQFFQKKILKFHNVIGTTQVEPLDNMINSGGFTDGDRILYFLRSILSPKNKIFLVGMDFGKVIGKYSKPYLTGNVEGGATKIKKLQFAVFLIEEILPLIQNELYFVNSISVSDKFQYLSLEDLKSKL